MNEPKELKFSVPICIDKELPKKFLHDPQILVSFDLTMKHGHSSE